MQPRVYLLGGYQTDFERNWSREGKGIQAMINEVMEGAFVDTGILPKEIKAIHVGNVVTRLVAVHIVADHAGTRDVFVVGDALVIDLHDEEAVEPLHELLGSAQLVHEARNIVRHVERVVPGIALDVALAVGRHGIKTLGEAAISVAGSQKTTLGIKKIFP